MSVEISVRVITYGEIEQLQLKKKIISSGVQRAVERIAGYVQQFAQVSCPVKTGALRSSIGTVVGNLIAVVTAAIYYAIYVNDGTYKMAGRFFMESGAAVGQGMADQILKEEIGELAS